MSNDKSNNKEKAVYDHALKKPVPLGNKHVPPPPQNNSGSGENSKK